MARAVRHLGILASAALAGALALAGAAVAGDRYGAGGYETQGYDGGYSSSYGSRDGDIEAIDPCAAQQRVTGRDCLPEGRVVQRRGEIQERRSERVYDDAGAVDPCAVQSHLVGRGCETGRYFSDRDESRGRGDVYGGWRAERGDTVVSREYGYEDRAYDRRGESPVDACEVAHERYGEICPYERRERFRTCCEVREERPVWVTEQLPESFFVSEGGVGGGVIDYGGGGGGFALAGGFSDASAFSSSSARASASASAWVSVAINVHNHQMHGWGGNRWGGGHGCGCKRGR